ncbi:NAD(P)-dependent oxidoreductase [Actinoplanes sichuanensis]|uniref:NAD-dependent epimerase/dehydratase family protein n=1 Tax=Actinoplanes sichuanensis TaxID=512349 RepID=A0ABW4A668_9ACTN|nr:NAD(P)-dependent oxidoreductase [Actinoplanes sichuanensis]BEL05093.1 NAD(P)-dependent oxidoreductase [Actinoplanes sichuanensis]
MSTLLITGAAGGVARRLIPALASAYSLRLTDRTPLPDAVTGDLRDAAFARDVCSGVDTIVHLAADANPNQPWSALREPNADAVVNVLEGAVAAKAGRVVLAGSLHALGGHVDAGAATIGEDAAPYPCCVYGSVKVFAETVGRWYAEEHGLHVVCLRLGGVRDRPMARSWLPGWLSGPDLVRLFTGALTADVRYGVYHGVSANSGGLWRHDRATAELGYRPVDDSARFAAEVPDDLSTGVGRTLHLT